MHGRTRRSSEKKPRERGASDFLDDVKRALLNQDVRPTYKRARAVIKGAVVGLEDGDLRSQLEQQLPAVLSELKRTLAPSALSTSPAKPTKRPRTAALVAKPKQAEYGAEAAYSAAVDAQIAAGAAAPAALLLARLPPPSALLNLPTPPDAPPCAAAITATADACSAAMAAALGGDGLPALLPLLQRCHAHLAAAAADVLVPPAAATDAISARRTNPAAVGAPRRAAHDTTRAALARAAALLALHAASAPPPVLLRPARASPTDPGLPHLHLAFAVACASVTSALLDAAAAPLSLARCRALIATAAAAARGVLPCSAAKAATSSHAFLVTAPFVRACLPTFASLSSDSHVVCIMGWLAVHSVVSAPAAGAPPLELIACQRLCARFQKLLGDTRAAAAALDALDGRPCDTQLLEWLQVVALERAVAPAVRAAAPGASAPVVTALLRAASCDAVVKLCDAWRASVPTGAGTAAMEELHDDALFLLDGGEPSAFAGGWHSASEGSEESSGGSEFESAAGSGSEGGTSGSA